MLLLTMEEKLQTAATERGDTNASSQQPSHARTHTLAWPVRIRCGTHLNSTWIASCSPTGATTAAVPLDPSDMLQQGGNATGVAASGRRMAVQNCSEETRASLTVRAELGVPTSVIARWRD